MPIEILVKSGEELVPVAEVDCGEVFPYIIVLKDSEMQQEVRNHLYKKGVAVDPTVVLSMVFVNITEVQADQIRKMPEVQVIERQAKPRNK